MSEQGITKHQIISELAKSPHGDLKQYAPVALAAAKQEPDFLAHLIAWNRTNGQIRDSKAALPVLSLAAPAFDGELAENSLAHLATLPPRELLKAYRFALALRWDASEPGVGGRRLLHGRMRSLERLITRYLRTREEAWPWWERQAVQHRDSMKSLYALARVKPCAMADLILFKGDAPMGTVFAAIRELKESTPARQAELITEFRIPFVVASGALGKSLKAGSPDLALALIERMTPTELVTNMKIIQKLGGRTVPAVRAALEAALAKAQTSKRATLKTTRAAEAVAEDDEVLSEKLRGLQEKQIRAAAGIDGNWLVLADKSGSMKQAIETGRHVAATLAKFVKGKVYLIFFDSLPYAIDVTGMSYDALLDQTKRVTAAGGTSIGCGLLAAIERKLEIDGISVISDGGEHQPPFFHHVYTAWTRQIGKNVPVYFYRLKGSDPDYFSRTARGAGIDLQDFDLTGGVDYYSLPNVVQTMRVNRYGLVEQIMETPLLKLDDVLKPLRSAAGVAA